MRLPTPRGRLSAAVITALVTGHTARLEVLADSIRGDQYGLPGGRDLVTDDDVQLTLWTMYELHYRGFDDAADDFEWDPHLIGVRRALEDRVLEALREVTEPWVRACTRTPARGAGQVAARLFELTESVPGAPLSTYLQREATREQFVEYLKHKSIYHLKESDPQSFVLPRIPGRAKVALAELQYDEYGGGRPERLHQHLFAQGLEAIGLSATYGDYLDEVGGATLAVTNVMNLFALRRNLAAASMGHLGAFEATSSEPCRKVAGGCRRLGLGEVVAGYFDEHIEADAVHEQLAFRDICGSLVDEDPAALEQVAFGAAAYLYSEALAGTHLVDCWAAGRSSLRGGGALVEVPSVPLTSVPQQVAS